MRKSRGSSPDSTSFRRSCACSILVKILGVILLLNGTVWGQSDGSKILEIVKASLAKQQVNLKGVIRKSREEEIAVQVFFRNENLQFLIGTERFHMHVGKDSAELFSMDENQSIKPFPSEKLNQKIANTDVTYEDFAFLFLYWPNPILQAEDNIAGEDCYRIQINNPQDNGEYKSVLIWIHKNYGMFWRIKAFDKNGDPVKQFDVDKIMRLSEPGSYGLKAMQVEALGSDARVKSISRIVFDDPGERPTTAKRSK